MMEADLQGEVSRVRDKVMDLELSTTKKLGEIEATVRVVKHDNANTQQMVGGLNLRLDRIETAFKADLKEISENLGKEVRTIGQQLTQEVAKLSGEINTNNIRTTSKLSFYAGIAATGTFIISASGVIIAFAAKFIGSH